MTSQPPYQAAGPWTVGYHKASPDRLVFNRNGDGTVTRTKMLPAIRSQWYSYEGRRLKVSVVVDIFEGPGGEHVRLGAGLVEVVSEAAGEPVTASCLSRVPVREMVVHAIQAHSYNSDRSDVTRGQALALMKRSNLDGNSPADDWRRAAEAHLDAQRDGRPTGAAVAKALGLGTGKEAESKARHYVTRARRKGVYDEVRAEREGRS